MVNIDTLSNLARLVRYYSLTISSEAGSGHPTSSLSAADLAVALFFSKFRFDFNNPDSLTNDRLIFSKGHASPLFYSLYTVAGVIDKQEIKNYRKINSNLEGHPTPSFKYTEAATGSLGQGLSIGLGEALAIKRRLNNKVVSRDLPKVYVLLGDGEMAEGSVWEAISLSSYYKLDNLVGILDVNRLGQSGQTMVGKDAEVYQKRLNSFGWNTIIVDGHNFNNILKGLDSYSLEKPTMIIAKTVKGKGVSFFEDKEGWHGKALPSDKLNEALKELGNIDFNLKGKVFKPDLKVNIDNSLKTNPFKTEIDYKNGDEIATREAYGKALVEIGKNHPLVIALDGDTKNSTYSEKFKDAYPERFFEMFIAEQNMVGTAIGMEKRGYKPFVSTFAAFFTRAYDQIRMGAISRSNIKLVGSHAGVSIGEDGPSQMGLEDISMMRSIFNSTVLYPSDGVSTVKLLGLMVNNPGISYLRTTRGKTPVIYKSTGQFKIGGSKVHKSKLSLGKDKTITIVTAGITLFEALKVQQELENERISIDVVDCYSIKPIDIATIKDMAMHSFAIITVEDHYEVGGIGDAVLEVLSAEDKVKVYKMGVRIMPKSGKPEELLKFCSIDKESIVKQIRKVLQ